MPDYHRVPIPFRTRQDRTAVRPVFLPQSDVPWHTSCHSNPLKTSSTLATLALLIVVLTCPAGSAAGKMNLDCRAKMTLEFTDSEPYDTVSGSVTGVDPGQVWVVLFAQTNRWYIQPYEDSRAYLPVSPDGTYEAWTHDWRQLAAFVIRKGYDALSEYEPFKPFPLSVDCVDVLGVAAHPTVQFSGYTWAVKAGDQLGPGPNNFLAGSENVWVDAQGKLHLRITHRDGNWTCAEVYLMQSLGYGRHTFYVSSRVDLLDKRVVASPFLYQDDTRELDLEFSRWDVDNGPNAQIVVQPWYLPVHLKQFYMKTDASITCWAFVVLTHNYVVFYFLSVWRQIPIC